MGNEQMSIEDKAIGYVLGSLSPEERDIVARERLFNADLDKEISLGERLYSGLRRNDDLEIPATEIWSRITGAIAKEDAALAKIFVEDCRSGGWQEYAASIQTKTLWSDKAILIRCNPGAVEEEHDQPTDEDEHILVVAGDLNLAGRIFGTGDYLRVPASAVHKKMTTERGCLLFTEYVPASVADASTASHA
ncbi:cupin domain-containing protein [Sphingorhabdus sp.]|uniref:cupin domain-containing protein n=1 Tax=Sphingorhabdus sp. TaxID=1902408 RepID=UPI0039839387